MIQTNLNNRMNSKQKGKLQSAFNRQSENEEGNKDTHELRPNQVRKYHYPYSFCSLREKKTKFSIIWP